HVSQRQQFGRPIGSFQALQHRLATGAMLIETARWLGPKAASTGDPADAALAAAHAKDPARAVVYDLPQFSGALGLRPRYPLHLFTYRANYLQSELGASGDHFLAAADELWPDPNFTARTAA